MSKLQGGSVASAVALMFAAGGVAAAEPVGSAPADVAETQAATICGRATVVPDTICAHATLVPDTICGRATLVPDTICGRATLVPDTICGRLSDPDEQPSTWCNVAIAD